MSFPDSLSSADARSDAESRVVAALVARSRLFWTLAVACGLADLGLTLWGLERGFVEGNPVAASVLSSHGAPGLVGLKAAAYGAGGAVYVLLPPRLAVGIPLGLALPAGYAVVHNIVVLSG